MKMFIIFSLTFHFKLNETHLFENASFILTEKNFIKAQFFHVEAFINEIFSFQTNSKLEIIDPQI